MYTPISQRQGVVKKTGYTPVGRRTIQNQPPQPMLTGFHAPAQAAASFGFQPPAEETGLFFETIRQFLNPATLADTKHKMDELSMNLAKAAAQGTARNVGSVGLSVINSIGKSLRKDYVPVELKSEEYGEFAKTLFGEEEGIADVQTRIPRLAKKIEPYVGERYAKSLSGGLIAAGIMGDLTVPGVDDVARKAITEGIEGLVKARNAVKVNEVIFGPLGKALGLTIEEAAPIVDDLVKATDGEQVIAALEKTGKPGVRNRIINSLIAEARPRDVVTEALPERGPRDMPRELGPLAREARGVGREYVPVASRVPVVRALEQEDRIATTFAERPRQITVEEFEKLAPEQQEARFTDLSEADQQEVMGDVMTGAESRAGTIDQLAHEIASGRKHLFAGQFRKKDAQHILGPNYVRVFRRDDSMDSVDEVVDTFNRAHGTDYGIDDMLEATARAFKERAVAKESLAVERTKLMEERATQRAAAKTEKANAAFLKEVSTDIYKRMRAKRYTLAQDLRHRAVVEARTAKAVAKKVRAETREQVLAKLRVAQEASQDIKSDIISYVKKNLDTADQGKALVMVRDAKTAKNLTKAFARVNRWAEEAEKKALRNEVLKAQKRIAESGSVAIEYQKRIKEVVSGMELRGKRESTLERLRATAEFLRGEVAKGNDVEIPRRVLKALETLSRKPFEEVTKSELRGALSEMEMLEGVGEAKLRTRQSIVDFQKERVISDVESQGAGKLENIPEIRPAIGERLTATQKMRNALSTMMNQAARIDRAITPMDAVFDLLDGGKATYEGANFSHFKAPVDAGYGRYITRRNALQEPVVDLATQYDLGDTNFERIGIVAAREQDGGIEKLVSSGFTEPEVNAVKLTAQEQEVLDLMRSTFDSQFPEIQDVMRRVYNKPVEKVKNYFSFMTDWKAMDEAEVFERFGSIGPEQYGAPKKNVEAGFTKSRVGGGQKIKVNALDVFLKHTDNTSYLLELGETTKMLGEIAASPKYAELVGDAGQLIVREWVDTIARKGGAAGASEIALLDVLRKNVGIGILGLKLSTVAIQPTSLIDGMGFIGAGYGMRGATEFSTDPSWRAFVGKMPEISDRLGGEFAIRELSKDDWLENIQLKGFIPMQALDQMTAGMVAAGAYIRKMEELGLAVDLAGPYNQEALAYAQLAVRRTQSTGAFKDVPLAISRGALTGNRSLDRAFLQFQNFLLNRWSRIRHDAFRAGIRTKDPKKAIPILTAMLMAAVAASGVRLGVNKITDFITGREDKDSVAEDLARNFIFELTGNVPFLGTAMSMAMYDGEMFPLLDAPKGVISGLGRAISAKSPRAKLRGLTEFAGSTGALLGIPGSRQAEQLVSGALQDKKGKSESGLPELPPLPKLPQLPALPKLPKLPRI